MTEILDTRKKEAFRLFEEGNYPESLALCTEILAGEKDSSIEILAATNLFNTGKIDEAGLFFRDLAARMPESSYVHSYLGKILDAKGDEGAIAEYAIAVRLDPSNQDALRSYADYLIVHRDFHAAVPVLKRLIESGPAGRDRKNLMRALIETGNAGAALDVDTSQGDPDLAREYLDALVRSGKYAEASAAGQRLYIETGDQDIQRVYLDALARHDIQAALAEYASSVSDRMGDLHTGIVCDYILLLRGAGKYGDALALVQDLLACDKGPAGRMLECELLAEIGDTSAALAAYESLVRDETRAGADPGVLTRIISRYRRILAGSVPAPEAKQRFLELVGGEVSAVCLLETARFFEERGEDDEARSWYYRSYRADFLTGGPPYARFLSERGDDRECEKVMLYLLTNAKKGPDLIRIAGVIVDDEHRMYRYRRLMEQLVKRLAERRASLGSDGLEILSIAFFIMATNALEEADYTACKYFCLCGMDAIPRHSSAIRLEDYLRIIRECKERSVADRPVMHTAQGKEQGRPVEKPASAAEHLGLSAEEARIVAFLRSHRTASEMDLRALMGTRRVAGIVNRIIRKAAAEGIALVSKKGVGDDGEIYEYTGT